MKKRMKKGKDMYCWGFPIIHWGVLLLAALWFLTDLGWVALDFPWLSAIVLLFSIHMLRKHYYWHMMQ